MNLALLLRSDDGGSASRTGGVVVTDSDLSPVLQIVAWLLLSLTTLMFCFRLLTSFFIKSKQAFGWEDIFISLAYIFGLVQTITLVVPDGRAFGRDIDELSSDQVTTALKLQLAKDILFLFGLGFAKLSVCAGLLSLSPNADHRRVPYIMSAVIIAWTVTAAFATGFQCGAGGTWGSDRTHCIRQFAFQEYIGITNILTDAVLILVPFWVFIPLQMALSTRLVVISLFSTRVLVVAATILQLVYLDRLFETNWTLRAFPYYICTQFVLFTSVSSACAVYIWPFLRSLRSGLMMANNTQFTSHYALSKLSNTNPVTIPRSIATLGSKNRENRDRRDYIEVTTENIISSQPSPWAESSTGGGSNTRQPEL